MEVPWIANVAAGANRWTSAEFGLLFCLPVHCFWMLLVFLCMFVVHCLYLFLCQPFCGLQRHSWIGRVQSSCCKVCIGIFGWKMRQLAHKQHPQAIITRLQLWAASQCYQCSMKANSMGMKWDEAMKPWAHGRETPHRISKEAVKAAEINCRCPSRPQKLCRSSTDVKMLKLMHPEDKIALPYSEELRKTSLKGLDIRVIVRYQYIRKSCLSKETGFRAC